jgi:protein-tyrosine phosphatase
MIVPYMSIDLFFIAAPFLCRTESELRTLRRRIIFGIIVAGLCFLLFPLRFAFERPSADGWLGVVFDAFRKMDKPYNLLPSLHITLRTILAAVYARHTRGPWRVLSHIWFSLIGISTLLTYQHHIVDVAGGFVLATLCFYTFREVPTKLPVLTNRRVGGYYAIATAALVFPAVLLRPWGLLFLWPAVALSIVSAAYFGVGPGIYRKTNGRLPLSTRCVLGPFLLGQWVSLRYYQRQCRTWDAVMPSVLIGRKLTNREAAKAVSRGVIAVLDLTAEFDEAKSFLKLHYCNVPVLDLTAPTQKQFRAMAEFIAKHCTNGIVYVHCKIGYSRSAGAVGAYLLASGRVDSVDEALAAIRAVRPSMIVRPEIISGLQEFSRAQASRSLTTLS